MTVYEHPPLGRNAEQVPSETSVARPTTVAALGRRRRPGISIDVPLGV